MLVVDVCNAGFIAGTRPVSGPPKVLATPFPSHGSTNESPWQCVLFHYHSTFKMIQCAYCDDTYVEDSTGDAGALLVI